MTTIINLDRNLIVRVKILEVFKTSLKEYDNIFAETEI